MNILVTGAAGFIGTNFVYYMLSAHPDYHIVGFDALTYAGCISNLYKAMANRAFTFIRGDICSREDVSEAFRKHSPDIVVNFAAESHVDRSIENPSVFIETNVMGTEILLEEAVKHGVRRFHQISTDEVYGDLPLERKDLKFTETSPLRPSSPYSASKAAADLLTMAYHRTYNLNVTISRCSNNFGPFQHEEKLIPKTISNAVSGKDIPIYGSGENIRDWIYVLDHCKAVDAIIHRGKDGEIYNIGADNELSNMQMVKYILSALGKNDSIIKHTEDRKGHDLRYAIDSSKLRKELGFSDYSPFSEKLAETVEWYRNFNS